MTKPPPLPQDPPPSPGPVEGLPPLPGLHEALAYIAKGHPPAPVVKLDPGLEDDDDDDLDQGSLDEADDPGSQPPDQDRTVLHHAR